MNIQKFNLLKEQYEKAEAAFQPAHRLHSCIDSMSGLLNNIEDITAVKLDVFTSKGGCHCVYIQDDKFKQILENALLNYMETLQNEFNRL